MSHCLTYSIIRQLRKKNVPLLDLHGGATVAYSLRKLSSDYTGYCVKVRRSSDDTEQDIGFNSQGGINKTDLLSFVGSGNGFVSVWYDQSGNGNNAAQTNTAYQPIIVNAGSVVLLNSNPSVLFDGVNDYLIAEYNCTESVLNMYMVFNKTGEGTSLNVNSRCCSFWRPGYADTNSLKTWLPCYVVKDTPIGYRTWRDYSAATAQKANYAERRFVFASKDTSKIKIGVNGESLSENNTSGDMDSTYFYIGCGTTTTGPVYDGWLNGYIDEIIIYPFSTIENKSSIETNINNFYSIY